MSQTQASGLRCMGIDGCPGGWVGVSRDTAAVRAALADLISLFDADIVALDMPIGLPHSQPRACEAAARRLLGHPRGTSVFPVPMRAALTGTSHAQASDLNQAASGRRLSAQTYNIMTKIRSVDCLLIERPAWQTRIWEVHPELSFACMNADNKTLISLAEGKKTSAGAAQRQNLIAGVFGSTAFATGWANVRGHGVAKDDLADAFACLFSAERIATGRHQTLPAQPALDEKNLPMRICY